VNLSGFMGRDEGNSAFGEAKVNALVDGTFHILA
jgi:hypothetical protein